ncbi:MAG: hypothetical protein WD598_13740 [Acidimicrobiia bacterium]
MTTELGDHPASPYAKPVHSSGRRWWGWVLRALPALAFLATFGYFFIDKNDAALSVVESGRGLLAIAAIVGGYILIATVLRRFVGWAWVAPVVLTVVVLVLAAWIVRPYYVDETDNTRLVQGPVVDASDSPDEEPSGSAAGKAERPGAPASSVPVRVAAGPIQGLDGHDGSGDVSLIREVDGTFVVRFENFEIEGTPSPVVYLIEGTDVQRPGGTDLGSQHGNAGTASDYAVPDGVSPGPGWTVLVWCESFSVPIANASLSAA